MLNIDRLNSRLRDRFDEKRYRHSLGVAETAVELAVRVGVSIKKARIAGLLHDYAKGLKEEKLIELVQSSEWDIDETELSLLPVLHAPAGAFLVGRDLGIDDMDILEAIRFHTIGSPGMGLLARIIFIADIIEPNRDFPGVETLRFRVKRDIDSGLITICNYSIKYNIDKGRIIHPNTLLLRNDLLGGYS